MDNPSEELNNFEREEKFLGFKPVLFVNDVLGAIEDYTCEGLDSFEHRLNESLGIDTKSNVDEILKTLSGRMDKNLDKFELYVLNNIFSIPKAYVLSNESIASSSAPVPLNMAQLSQELEATQTRLDHASARNRTAKLNLLWARQQLEWARRHEALQVTTRLDEVIDPMLQARDTANNVNQLKQLLRSDR